MTTVIDQQNMEQFLARFNGFMDSVVRSISLWYGKDGSKNVEIRVSARDSQASDNEGWVCAVIRAGRVREMGVRESDRTSNQVLGDGLHMSMMGDLLALEFGGAVEAPESIEEYRESDAYVIAAEAVLSTEPY